MAKKRAVNVFLSLEETYADINPVRFQGNGVTAFVSIIEDVIICVLFVLVPYTRGRERSRDPKVL